MSDAEESVNRYVSTLQISNRDKEEASNVILGYMTDCVAKDKRIYELEAALTEIKDRFEGKLGEYKISQSAYQVVCNALDSTTNN